MKTKFSSIAEVMHIYAQRTQPSGQSSNVFFENTDKIYSYGHHYLLGEFITNQKNELAIMINNKGYSVSTAKHINVLTRATSQYKQFFLPNCDEKLVLNQLENLINKLANAKKPEIYINQAQSLNHYFCLYLDWKNDSIDNYPEIKAAVNFFSSKDIDSYMKSKAEAIKQREKIERKKQRKAEKASLKEFFNYQRNYCSDMIEDYCRISLDGTMIETTQNAKVPIKEAKLLYQMILSGKDIKGFKIDNYTVIGLNGVLKIGCHKINVKNMHDIGKKILSL